MNLELGTLFCVSLLTVPELLHLRPDTSSHESAERLYLRGLHAAGKASQTRIALPSHEMGFVAKYAGGLSKS